MNCADFERRLQDRLDGAAAAGPAGLDEHLAACPACRERQAAARRLEEGLRLLAAPAPPAGLAERITARALAERRARLRLRQRLRTTLAVAASLLLVLVTVRDRPPAPEPLPVAAVGEDGPPPSLREDFAEASSAMVDLTRRTADETVGQGRLFVPVVVARPDGMDIAALPSGKSLREAGQGVSTGLEPVTDSARRALDLFLNEIPPMGPDAKQGS
jgi:Putative zinc-finger